MVAQERLAGSQPPLGVDVTADEPEEEDPKEDDEDDPFGY
jgi:hypothetical protein